MYQYDEYDQRIVDERVAQFADQTQRYLAGELSEDEFRPLRLQNGLYIQRYAPMLRIAVPYGNLNSKQLRTLGHIARKYDRGYGHVTTRQNIQFNWPRLEDVPEILGLLAQVQMHAIQTSGNCIRNVTSDPFAGVAADEIADPRPWCEILRQWSTFHPEFAFLPRKFKIAVNGAKQDRALIHAHDIGLDIAHDAAGALGFRVLVGGGLGRTPIIGEEVSAFVPWQQILNYCEAILRVYNLHGRRDNAYKARIKILVKALGVEEFARQVEAEFIHLKDGPSTLTQAEIDRVASRFDDPLLAPLPQDAGYRAHLAQDKAFAAWARRNVRTHQVPGYASVVLSLKPYGVAPGDVTAEQFDAIADLADRYAFGEVRNTHEQNVLLASVREAGLFALWQQARELGLATPNIGLLTDIISCPGGDFCALANAKSIPIANAIQDRFSDLDHLYDLGELELNISGCMNACGHHHVGHIGILGVDKNGQEFYQVTIGGSQGSQAALGKVIGPSFAAAEMPDVISSLIDTFVDNRHDDERFIDTVRRIGVDSFKTRVYAERNARLEARETTNA
ncbi:nitrite/sulfite reductase [Thauera linaloolentis]|uniref:Putative sulfite reductase n=1 Tax=Thauera linaloolentis (strain DSM 12138 / JCM 21573 / CCUG 41526 / CIP 105981 / IAM 15112 / NBRC 102519 / 47Lol) TaxID=1123367 RepID=N6Z5I4_THAL4|nr:nitrite/sulfite reductase [Thauera linaloolentis]ENO89683.1 putative sulfite reductase [Thauera linaloolentis 47Lol = DSM 12138]MCM8567163.1 nitrite/sulfite reductase [Thauera linaloolentis]